MLKLIIGIFFCLSTVSTESSHNVFTFKCSTAMICTDIGQCDQKGMYVKSGVSLTAEQEAFRQPLVPCKKPEGDRGVCCQDPDFKDFWPVDWVDKGMKPKVCNPPQILLPGGYCGLPPTIPPINKERDECVPPRKYINGKCREETIITTTTPRIVVEKTTTETIITIPPPTKPGIFNPNKPDESRGCPPRNRTAMPDKVYKPYDSSDYEAGAGEFPWQGAVFTKSGSFLCVCYNTIYSTCTTTASCVKDYNPSDLQVAVGIHDIADPKSVFEITKGDKNPQISGCKAIAYDPNYDSATGKYDIAILHLANKVSYNHYTKAICLDEFYSIPFFSYDDCVVTGWGDSNTLHYVDVELLSESECKSAVPGFDSNAMSCAKPNHDVCKLVEFGGGFHCRETGKRNKKSADIYLLKGTYSGVNCGKNVITFSRIDFDGWFKDALINPDKYPNRDSSSSNKIR